MDKDETPTIKFPKPQTARQKLEAALLEAGLPSDQIEILTAKRTKTGPGSGVLEADLMLRLSPEVAERLVKALTIKAFDPDAESKPSMTVAGVRSAPVETPAAKIWTGKERGRRSKPKSDTPDLP